ncbi:lactate oxidase [Fusobacterium ulcerans]|uniref:lactate oxidase n=1 Tax=Fusobacterium ulcerans TaxID=861 RepID=UPI0034C2D742
MSTKYFQSENEKEINIINFTMLEEEAKKIIPAGGYGYINGGAEDEWTLRMNTEAFNHKQIVPRSLTDVEKPDLTTTIYGEKISMPIFMTTVASHGLAHKDGEIATAKGTAAAGTIMGISTYSTKSLDEIMTASTGPKWFQLYMSKDDKFNEYMIGKAVANGAKAVILTVDATLGGYREADLKNNFIFPLPMGNLESLGEGLGQSISEIFANAKQKIGIKDIEKIVAMIDLPVIVKGIESPEDALLAIGAGAKGIYVSNHGGRQLDGGPASFDVLESIAKAVNKKVPIIFDSGVRRGQHVFKALASGADLVGIGRPAIYGLAVGGSKGVTSVFKHFAKELKIVMQLAGCQTVEDIKKAKLLSIKY